MFGVLVRKIQRNFEDYGWVQATQKMLSSLVEPLYFKQIYRIYLKDLQAPPSGNESCPHAFTFKVLEGKDTVEIDQIESIAEWFQGKLQRRIQEGDLCLVALDRARVVGFNLVTFGRVWIPLIERERCFRAGEAWSEQITVHKDFRGKGLASLLRYKIFGELRSRGFRKLYGGTLRTNLPSLKLTRRVGFREIADITYVKMLGTPRWRYGRVKN